MSFVLDHTGTLYSAYAPVSGLQELFISYTKGGVAQLTYVNSNGAGVNPYNFLAVGASRAVFIGYGPESAYNPIQELWVTDGTASGTYPLSSVNYTVVSGATFGSVGLDPYDFVTLPNGNVEFRGVTGTVFDNGEDTTTEGLYETNGSSVWLACFAAGTRIDTARGAVAVEALRVGDFARVASGDMRPIVWIGRRRIDCTRHRAPQLVWPVRIVAGAFGVGLPQCDLLLSPDHAIHADGMLIPVKRLIDGEAIEQVPVASVMYYHVELPRHDIILAEGLPVESYLDTSDRRAFANGGGAIMLHPNFTSGAWEAEGCAPLVVCGPELEGVRQMVVANAIPRQTGAASECSAIGEWER